MWRGHCIKVMQDVGISLDTTSLCRHDHDPPPVICDPRKLLVPVAVIKSSDQPTGDPRTSQQRVTRAVTFTVAESEPDTDTKNSLNHLSFCKHYT